MWGRLVGFFDGLDAFLSLWGRFFGYGTTMVVGLVSAWGAFVAKLFVDYAPFSYIFAGVFSAAVFAFALACVGWFRLGLARARAMRQVSRPVESVNPLDTTFVKRRISLVELADPVTRIIDGKTFVDCDLVGLKFTFAYSRCTFDTPKAMLDCDMVALPIGEGESAPLPSNAYMIKNCSMHRCKFHQQTMLFNQPTAQHIFKVAKGLQWIVPPPKEENGSR